MSALRDLPNEDDISGRWMWFVGFGIVLVILGLVALWNVVDATLVTTLFIGWLLVLGGIAQIVGAFVTSGSTGRRILVGVLGVIYALVGLNIIADPLRGAVTLAIVIAVGLIVEGIIRLVNAVSGPPGNRSLIAAVAIIDILLGLWLWSGIPVSGLAIGFFVGLQLLMTGIVWIIGGWMSRSDFEHSAPHAAL